MCGATRERQPPIDDLVAAPHGGTFRKAKGVAATGGPIERRQNLAATNPVRVAVAEVQEVLRRLTPQSSSGTGRRNSRQLRFPVLTLSRSSSAEMD